MKAIFFHFGFGDQLHPTLGGPSNAFGPRLAVSDEPQSRVLIH
jgi:hypothetical protein